jgi:hypothetical protein
VVILSAAKTGGEAGVAGVAGPTFGVENTTGRDPATDRTRVTHAGAAGG